MPLHIKGSKARLGSLDPHSYAEFEDAVVEHLSLHLRLSFDEQAVAGTAKLKVKRLKPDATRVRLDIYAPEESSKKK